MLDFIRYWLLENQMLENEKQNKSLTTCSSWESASTMFGVWRTSELPDACTFWFVVVSGTEEGLEDRLMAPPAPWPVELTPSSVVSLLVVTEIVVVSLS